MAKMAEGVGNAPTSGLSPSCFRDRCSQLVSACLPEMVRVERIALPSSSFRGRPPAADMYTLKLAARVGLAPTPCGLTNRRATLTPPGNGAAGRSSTCIVPFRRRMPHVFGHDSSSNWSEWQDFHLRPPGPKPGALKTELHSEKMADPKLF